MYRDYRATRPANQAAPYRNAAGSPGENEGEQLLQDLSPEVVCCRQAKTNKYTRVYNHPGMKVSPSILCTCTGFSCENIQTRVFRSPSQACRAGVRQWKTHTSSSRRFLAMLTPVSSPCTTDMP